VRFTLDTRAGLAYVHHAEELLGRRYGYAAAAGRADH
jgi:hypothetical protein